MKKVWLIILSCLMVFVFPACKKDVNLYNEGIEVATTMEKMVKSDDYFGLTVSLDNDFQQIREEKLIANDYDTPIKVYSISIPNKDTYLRETGVLETEEWANLSSELREQVKNTLTDEFIFNTILNSLISYNNSYKEKVTIFNLLVYRKAIQDSSLKSSIMYLYIFETGNPIIVLFSASNNKIDVEGHFILSDELNSLSSIRGMFEEYGCEVNVVK